MQKTCFPIEIIIHDDCSTDGTSAIIREYEKQYPQLIKPIYQSENQYSKKIKILPTYVWPKALGKYIAVCEGDDYWLSSDKLQKQVDFMEMNPEFSICFHNIIIQYDDHSKDNCHYNSPIQQDTTEFNDILVTDYIATCSVLYRGGLVKKIPDWTKSLAMGDWPLHILHAQFGKIKYMKDVMGVYRVHSSNTWSGKSRIYQVNETLKALDVIKQQYLDNLAQQSIDKAYRRNFLDGGLYYIKEDNIEAAKFYLAKAFKNDTIPYEAVTELAQTIVYYLSDEDGIVNKKDYLDIYLNNLFFACPRVPQIRKVKGYVFRAYAWQAVTKDNRQKIKSLAWKAILIYPRLLFDRGLVSIWLRATFGLPLPIIEKQIIECP